MAFLADPQCLCGQRIEPEDEQNIPERAVRHSAMYGRYGRDATKLLEGGVKGATKVGKSRWRSR